MVWNQDKIVELLAAGCTIEQAAEALGYSKFTLFAAAKERGISLKALKHKSKAGGIGKVKLVQFKKALAGESKSVSDYLKMVGTISNKVENNLKIEVSQKPIE